MDKEYIRQQFVGISCYLNMSELCRKANVNEQNFANFKKGDLGRLSVKKLRALIVLINDLHINMEE